MSEHGEQSGPATGAAAFHRSGGDTQDRGGLRHRVALHIDQHQSRLLVDGEFGQGRQQLTVEVLALGGGLRRLMRLQELLQPLGVVHGRGLAGGGLAGPVETGIHGDPVQPGGHRGLTAEGMGRPEGGDQGILHRVRRFLPVAESPYGDGPEPVAVAPYQFTEGMRVACDMSAQQVLVTCIAECDVVQR